jgi:hypothetical protein
MQAHDAGFRPSADEVASSFGVTQVLAQPSRTQHRAKFATRSKLLAAGAAAAIVAAVALATVDGGKEQPARVEPVPHATSTSQQARNLSDWLKTYSR